MKTPFVKRFFSIFLLAFLSSNIFLFSQDESFSSKPLAGIELSSYLENYFKYLGFSPARQSLTKATDSSFPYNLTVTLEKNVQTTEENGKTGNIVVAFTQEYASRYLDGITSFILDEDKKEKSYSITVVFTAGDNNMDFDTDKPVLSVNGSKIYAEEIKDLDDYIALVIEEPSEDSSCRLIPGGSGDICPFWMVKAIYETLHDYGIQLLYPSSFIFLYRNRLIQENPRVSSFFASNIPTAGITMGINVDEAKILEELVEKIHSSSSSKWDRHYIFMSNEGKTYIAGEAILVVIFLFFSGLVLFSLSFSTFSNSAKSLAIRKDIGRNWYFSIIYLLLTSVVLIASQNITSLFTSSAIDILSSKVLITLLFMFILILLQVRFNLRISFQSLGYEVLFVMAVNVFVFTSVDLSLMFLFFFDYIIAFLFRKAQKPHNLFIFAVLICFPFVPYAINILNYSDFTRLYKAVKCGYWGNFLTALILLPLELHWTRILIKFDIFTRYQESTMAKKILKSALLVAVSGVVIFTGLKVFDSIIKQSNSKNSSKTVKTPIDHEKENHVLDFSSGNEEFMELSIKSLTINASAKIVRYDIIIEPEADSSIYDCNYDYEILGDGAIGLYLPEYPASTLNIIFTSDLKSSDTIKIDAYVQNTDGSYSIESKKIVL